MYGTAYHWTPRTELVWILKLSYGGKDREGYGGMEEAQRVGQVVLLTYGRANRRNGHEEM